MHKDFIHKVYRKSKTTAYQRIYDGDFEGLQDANFSTYWQGVGTPTIAARTTLEAYPERVQDSAMELDGIGSYIQLPTFGYIGTFGNPEIGTTTGNFTMVIPMSKANWNDGVAQTILNNTDNIAGLSGIYLFMTSGGQLTFRASINGAYQQCQYALSNISSGQHDIAISVNGNILRLYVDGVIVATNSSGSGSLVSFGFTPLYLGANVVGGVPSAFLGATIGSVMVYDTLLTESQLQQMLVTRSPRSTNLVSYFTFNNPSNEAGTAYRDQLTVYSANVVGGVQVPGFGGLSRSVMVRTSTGGSSAQGISQSSGTSLSISGSQVYTASAYAKAPTGETINLVVTPTGGGSAQSVSVTADGTWQKIVNTYTTDPAATNIAVSVTLSNASASVKTFYVDRVAVNDGSIAYDYFDLNTPSVGGSQYYYSDDLSLTVGEFIYRTYISTWNDVVTNPNYQQEINTFGSEMMITLQRDPNDFGEGVDVDFGLEVQIFVVDEHAPNGRPHFMGVIANYTPNHDTQQVEVALDGQAVDMPNISAKAGELQLASQPNVNTQLSPGFWGNAYAITISPDRVYVASHFIVRMAAYGIEIDSFNVLLYRGRPDNDFFGTTGGSSTYSTSNTLITTASLSGTIPADVPAAVQFDFPSDVRFESGLDYYIVIVNGANEYPVFLDGAFVMPDDATNAPHYKPFRATSAVQLQTNNSGNTMTPIGAAYVELWASSGSQRMPMYSMDPSDMLKRGLDSYAAQGGAITYDDQSIEMTNTVATYTFNSMDVASYADKCLELAPQDWYYYIEQSTNKFHFKKKRDSADHVFVMGEDFSSLQFEKITDSIVNIVEFTGGKIGDGVNFFKRYVDQASIDMYGPKLKKYVDGRVTLESTADILAKSTMRPQPEVRTTFTIEEDSEIDIDIIRPGDTVGFRGTNSTPENSSLWDVGNWDEMFWDYNVRDPATLVLQIARFEYQSEQVSMTLSTTPPDVNKRIEDINRNLEAMQMLDNPGTTIE